MKKPNRPLLYVRVIYRDGLRMYFGVENYATIASYLCRDSVLSVFASKEPIIESKDNDDPLPF